MTILPDYVSKFKGPGLAIKKVNNSYYLYSKKCIYVKETKGNKVVFTYIGIIHPTEGLIKKEDTLVFEYGLSRVILSLLKPNIAQMKTSGLSNDDICFIVSRYISVFTKKSYLTRIPLESYTLEESKYHYIDSIKLDESIINKVSSLDAVYLIKRGKILDISKIDDAWIKVLESLNLSIEEFKKVVFL